MSELPINISNPKWYGKQIRPPLQICSLANRLHSPRPKIATVGIPDEIKQQIIDESQLFASRIKFSVDSSSFLNFSNIKEMEDYVTSKNYGTSSKHAVCFGMYLEEKVNTEGKNEYKYSLHYFDSIFEVGVPHLVD